MITEKDLQILEFVWQYGSITINQAYQMFFSNAAFGRDMARKRLKKLNDIGLLNKTILAQGLTNELIYYKERPVSPHKLILLNLYAALKFYGAKINEFKMEYKVGNVRPDAFISFDYKDYTIIAFVEVVLTHQVNYKAYEELKNTGQLQNELGTFPLLVVIANNPEHYTGKNLKVKYLDYKLKNIHQELLP
ncbi:hypothetical protein Q3V94_09295 [Caloramator sp. CAR-1]|uniref:hypothetical protein n=1 Tax=Caloramator sp. CAR-1 TaxID=3062777 RepID=UPI0026E2899A|nr:hypothetical protein [Caloramator sp. CAR-1]MDO6355253.1 hypothetical protein [Caloramator sp. CAR-1]